MNEIDLTLLENCLITYGSYDLDKTKSIVDHFPTSKYLYECMKIVANHLDSVPSLYFLNHIINQLERKDQVVSALKMNNIVVNMITCIQKTLNSSNANKDTNDVLELSLEILNRIVQIDKQLFPSSSTLFVLGLSHLHFICGKMKEAIYYDLSEPFIEADLVNNWLLLLNTFAEGQSQKISLQCASYVIQYMPSIMKV